VSVSAGADEDMVAVALLLGRYSLKEYPRLERQLVVTGKE